MLPRAAETTELLHTGTPGVVQAIDAMEVALVSLELGAGRQRSGDKVNHAVGVDVVQVQNWDNTQKLFFLNVVCLSIAVSSFKGLG